MFASESVVYANTAFQSTVPVPRRYSSVGTSFSSTRDKRYRIGFSLSYLPNSEAPARYESPHVSCHDNGIGVFSQITPTIDDELLEPNHAIGVDSDNPVFRAL